MVMVGAALYTFIATLAVGIVMIVCCSRRMALLMACFVGYTLDSTCRSEKAQDERTRESHSCRRLENRKERA
jgi:hypothetical protein